MNTMNTTPEHTTDLVLVQVPDNEEWVTLAQLERHHAEQYIEHLKSDLYQTRVLENIANSRSPLERETLEMFNILVQSAVFTDSFRLVPYQQLYH